MIDCEHLQNNLCLISTQLAGVDVPAALDACTACLKQPKPKQQNHVTCAKAIYVLRINNKEVPQSLFQGITKRTPQGGPGTELEKLISWFKVKSSKCNCGKRIQKMNQWGPDKCEERMDTILRWLQHSAITNKLPFVRPVVERLVRKAISNARSKMGSSGNNSTS